MPLVTTGRPPKRVKLESVTDRFIFTNAQDIKQALRTQDSNALPKVLSALRAKLSLKSGETISPHDERLSLVKLWLDGSPDAQDLFDIWGATQEMSTQALVTSLFSSLLLLLSSHFSYHSYGVPIIKTLLSPHWSRRLNSFISGSHNELILTTLKLFSTISDFGSGRERKLVFETFPWDNKTLPKLLYMRRKGKAGGAEDALALPDIRTYYILFILSFVGKDTPPSVKAPFLEQRREVFMSIFKGLIQDQYSVIQKVLQVCWEGLWSDPKIRRTTKVGLFNEVTISHLLKLYDRATAEKQGGEHVPADVVHHFLLAVCSRPGQGICFRDRGWYPRETDERGVVHEEATEGTWEKGAFTGKIYNKILANVLRTLKVNEDARQQELALKMIAACPELVAGYWSGAALTLEPRRSSKWIANIMFAGQVLSQAVPASSFLLPGSAELYNPSPPPLSTIMANVLPSVGTKVHFTKGLQTGSAGIVQHCTALVLIKCLRKLAEVMRVFKMVEAALEEEEDEGQWSRRRNEVEKEARRRVPEFQVVVAFSQQNLSACSSSSPKHALLSESSQRLLWLYQECLPDVVAEARFEVGKLVLNLAEGSLASLSLSGESAVSSVDKRDEEQLPSPLQSIKQLHVLRLLNGTDQFAWAGKVASSSHTYLHVLLNTFCNTHVRALRTTLSELLQHILAESVIFQEDPSEVELWLAALPSGHVRRGQGTETPDGAPLTDEVDAIATFLDDCTQRCLKTPYRYMEAMSDLLLGHTHDTSPNMHCAFASPLLMTVVEQVVAKVGGKLITPSDTLAVFTFLRQLLVRLASKQEDEEYGGLHTILDKLETSASGGQPFPDHPSIGFGIRRELSIARACLRHLGNDDCRHTSERSSDKIVADFLDRIEQIPVPASETARLAGAFELVDWLRLADVNPSPSGILRIASVIRAFYEPALWVLVDYLHPSDSHLWGSELLELFSGRSPVESAFVWLYFQCNVAQIQDLRVRNILLTTLYSRPVAYIDLERAIYVITHGVGISKGRHGLTAALLSLLSAVLEEAKRHLNDKDLQRLRATAVVQSAVIQVLCISCDLTAEVQEALQGLIEACFHSTNAEDKKLLSPISSHWAETMKTSLSSGQPEELRYARPWIKFMDAEELLAIVDLIQTDVKQPPMICETLEDILAALKQTMAQNSTLSKLTTSRLLALQVVLPGSVLLEDMLSAALVSQLPCGIDGQATFSDGQSLFTTLFNEQSAQTSELGSFPPNLILQFLEKETWTDSTAKIISVLLYANIASSQIYATWLNSKKWTQLSLHHLASTLVPFLDCVGIAGGDLSQVNDDVLYNLFNQLFPKESSPASNPFLHLECVYRILRLEHSKRPRLLSALQECVRGIRLVDLQFETTYVACKVLGLPGCETLATSIIDRALQWAVRYLSNHGTGSEDSQNAIVNLKNLARRQTKLKTHLVEPLLTIIIQDHLSENEVVELAVALVGSTPLKPVVVNRLLQNILQHQHFFRICGTVGSSSVKNQVTCLLDALFRLHPTNTCQPSHIEPLVRIYGGTMSESDRRLLSLMRLFEAEKRTSISSFLARWSPSPDTTVTNVLEVVQNLDPIQMLRTCLAFPSWRRFGEEKGVKGGPVDGSMYDPLIVIVLSAQMLVEYPPTTALGWVKVFRTNVVSLLIRCLSSKDPNIREAALCQIARLWESVQKSDMQERLQVVYVLRLLRNVMPPSANAQDPPRRLPTYASLILLHALRGIFYPSNFIYPRTARFLLQRPELDVSDVPMLFGMLYSSSDEWKKERGWIIRMLGDGMASTEDWKVLKRRHTWDLVASLFQSSKHDVALRTGILEILANLTCNSQACTSLILKSSLLSWIEMQLGDVVDTESIAWLRILENVVFLADTSKLERATGDGWCAIICRCVSSLLQTKNKNLSILDQSAALIVRLSLIPGIPDHPLRAVLGHAVEYLRQLEPSIDLRSRLTPKQDTLANPPHPAQGLHDVQATSDPLRTWGEIVEALWRVSMSLEHGTCVWDVLTRKLLIWRAISGDEESQVGEWVRREVIRILRTSS
ncbi:hypothetical protein BDN67DRAFT_955439 [Paxillus ammoniavirescens]|nr:hypothetical protein BDN67DRAFT_955439 [Paxillus ammoniavirescens]